MSPEITPDSAAAVHDGDVLDLLAALVDRSLLQVADPGAPRYRMLETLREYGVEKLEEAGELDATRTAHARHFAALAEEADPHLRGPEQLEWLALLFAERDNLTAGLRWLAASGDARRALRTAIAMGWFWLVNGEGEEAQAAMKLVAEVPGDADPADRVIVDALAHDLGGETMAEAREKLVALLDALEDTGFTRERQLGVAVAPMLALMGGDDARAARLFDRAREHPSAWVRATVPLALAQKAENDGEPEEARARLPEAMAGFREAGDRWALGIALMSWGTLRTVDGALDEAAAALEEAHGLLADLNQGGEQAMLLIRLADVRLRQDRVDEARELIHRSRRATAPGSERDLMTLALLGRFRAVTGEFDGELRDELVAMLDKADDLGPERQHVKAICHVTLAALAHEAGEDPAGHLATAFTAALASEDMPILSGVGTSLADVLTRERPVEAAEALGAAAVVRGSDDPTAIEVKRVTRALREALGDDGFDAAYGRGRALERAAAIEAIDPARRLDPARVGA